MGGTTALTYSLATRVDLLAMARLLTHFLDDPLLRPWTPGALERALADPGTEPLRSPRPGIPL